MKFLVIGCGSIGERHIKNIKHLSCGEILAYDLDPKRLGLVKNQYGATVFTDLDAAFSQNAGVVFVCTPPSSHISTSLKAIKNNSHVFIEKPMSNTIDGIDDLIKTAEKNELLISVGYNFRFHEGLMLVKKMIDGGELGRIYSARAEVGQ